MSRDYPTNSDDVIDLDDVRERIEELESERSDLVTEVEAAQENSEPECDCEDCDGTGAVANPSGPEGNRELACEACAERLREAVKDAKDALDEWDRDSGKELKDLQDFLSEADGLDGPMYRESYFETHARELADDCGLIPKDAGWPCTCIDWDQAARELQMDYTGADFDGITYYGR